MANVFDMIIDICYVALTKTVIIWKFSSYHELSITHRGLLQIKLHDTRFLL